MAEATPEERIANLKRLLSETLEAIAEEGYSVWVYNWREFPVARVAMDASKVLDQYGTPKGNIVHLRLAPSNYEAAKPADPDAPKDPYLWESGT